MKHRLLYNQRSWIENKVWRISRVTQIVLFSYDGQPIRAEYGVSYITLILSKSLNRKYQLLTTNVTHTHTHTHTHTQRVSPPAVCSHCVWPPCYWLLFPQCPHSEDSVSWVWSQDRRLGFIFYSYFYLFLFIFYSFLSFILIYLLLLFFIYSSFITQLHSI